MSTRHGDSGTDTRDRTASASRQGCTPSPGLPVAIVNPNQHRKRLVYVTTHPACDGRPVPHPPTPLMPAAEPLRLISVCLYRVSFSSFSCSTLGPVQCRPNAARLPGRLHRRATQGRRGRAANLAASGGTATASPARPAGSSATSTGPSACRASRPASCAAAIRCGLCGSTSAGAARARRPRRHRSPRHHLSLHSRSHSRSHYHYHSHSHYRLYHL